MVLVPYPPGDQARFAELSEIYGACRDAFRVITAETNPLGVAGSLCALDRDALVERRPSVAETSENLITWAVQLYLWAASEHIGALRALYQEGEVLISPLVLARAAIENSAHVIWILGSSDDSAEDRLARSFLEKIVGAEEAKKQAGRLRGKADEEHRERTRHYRQVKKDAAASFEAPHQDGEGRPVVNGHQMPSPEQIVLEMNRLASQPLADDIMQGTYGLLSNFVHPTFDALAELFSVSGEGEERMPTLNRDITFHDRLARLVVAPFYHAVAYVASYYGWASGRFDELNRDIIRLLPGTFVAGPSPGPFDRPLPKP